MNEQREAQKGGGGESLRFASPGTGAQATSPAILRQLAAELRDPPWPGENLRAAALEAAAQLDVVEELRVAAAIVVRSNDAAGCPPWPAIVVLNEVLPRSEAKL
jgi:hypothetical protein